MLKPYEEIVLSHSGDELLLFIEDGKTLGTQYRYGIWAGIGKKRSYLFWDYWSTNIFGREALIENLRLLIKHPSLEYIEHPDVLVDTVNTQRR